MNGTKIGPLTRSLLMIGTTYGVRSRWRCHHLG